MVEQKEGLAIVSPISPILANMYIHGESSQKSPRIWKRYVDDVPTLNYTSHHLVSVKRSVVNTLFKRLKVIPSDETPREKNTH